MNKKLLRNIAYGFLAWLIPFALSFLFYTKDRELTIDIFLFQSIMIVAGTTTSSFLLVAYFKKIKKNFLHEGVLVGAVWFAINIILDILILVPMSGMIFTDYFTQIGLRYLAIPAIAVAIGAVLENKK